VPDAQSSAGNPHVLCHIRRQWTAASFQKRSNGALDPRCPSGQPNERPFPTPRVCDHAGPPAEDVSLEKALQYIKGGFSFRVKKELAFGSLIWEESFTNHRIRDAEDYQSHRDYIHHNPVKAGLVKKPSEYPYSSAFPGMELDPAPPALKRFF